MPWLPGQPRRPPSSSWAKDTELARAAYGQTQPGLLGTAVKHIPERSLGFFLYPESPRKLNKHREHLSIYPTWMYNAFSTANPSTASEETLTWGYLGRRQRRAEKENGKTGFI